MGVGPVDIVIVEFPNEGLRTELVDILADLISNDTIRILDLLIVSKDADGGARAVEIDDLGDELQQRFSELDGAYDSLLSDKDVGRIADALSDGSTAVAVVWENTWAARMAEDIAAAQGTVVVHERIPAEAVEAALVDLEVLAASGAE